MSNVRKLKSCHGYQRVPDTKTMNWPTDRRSQNQPQPQPSLPPERFYEELTWVKDEIKKKMLRPTVSWCQVSSGASFLLL
jgi:hypothetical protein